MHYCCCYYVVSTHPIPKVLWDIVQALPSYFLLGSCWNYDLVRRTFFFLWKDCSILILTYLRIRSPTTWQNNDSIENHPWDLGDVLEIHKS